MPGFVCKVAAVFLLALLEAAHAQLDIGPYVQNVSAQKAVVIWYTANPEPGFLRYGKEIGQWAATLQTASTIIHRVELASLLPATKYFYEIGNGSEVYVSGADYYVLTFPPAGARLPFRFTAFGDFGTGDENQRATAAQLLRDDPRHEFALLLGDLIYSQGARGDYLVDYFPVYQDIIRHRPWWPTLGNHDIKAENGAAYFEFFETPANNPRQVENYYSFDYANAHIICLDDELLFKDAQALQEQLDWAQQDLRDAQQHGQRWLIAMWHRPPYSGGSHPDDREIQAKFVPPLEAAGVDLVLNGHSHVAERTFLLNNHSIVNQSLTQYPKNGFTPGTVYVVSGAGGNVDPLEYDSHHPLMAFQLGEVSGYESIYIHGDTLKGSWVKNDGQVMDRFVLIKTGNVTNVEILEQAGTPRQFATHYPNPLHASRPEEALRLRFELAEASAVTAAIYDLLGHEIARLSTAVLFPAGTHQLLWNHRDQVGRFAAAGVYFYRIQAGRRTQTAKFLLLP